MKMVEFCKKLLSFPHIQELAGVAKHAYDVDVIKPKGRMDKSWADIHNLCVSAFGAIIQDYTVSVLWDGRHSGEPYNNHGTRIVLRFKRNLHWAIRDVFKIEIEHRTVPHKDSTGCLWRKGIYVRIGISVKGYSQSDPLVSSKTVEVTRKYVNDFLDSQLDDKGLAYWEKTNFNADFEALKRKYARKGIRVVGSLHITRKPK